MLNGILEVLLVSSTHFLDFRLPDFKDLRESIQDLETFGETLTNDPLAQPPHTVPVSFVP